MLQRPIEGLESRRLLAGAILEISGRLRVTGSGGNDTITIGLETTAHDVQVNINSNQALFFERGAVKSIYVTSGAGNDTITITDTNGKLLVKPRVLGEDGNDTITGAGENDILEGGNGNDSI